MVNYILTQQIIKFLLRIEGAKNGVLKLPLTPAVLSSLRETARLHSTHYSTMIEGNRLDSEQIEQVLKHKGHFPGRERDEREVLGYYAALHKVERWAAENIDIDDTIIQTIHALVMGGGQVKVKPTLYRDGQNVIRDGRSGAIIYLPPEAKDVPSLMHELLQWIEKNRALVSPLVAAIVHYQFATIHPFYDGNGRTARLLTTLILHRGGYDLKGIYSLEEYYARDLQAYYDAISVGASSNYYMGRAEADITTWIEYFIEGMAISFENVLKNVQAADNRGEQDLSFVLRSLDPAQRKVLELFRSFREVSAQQVSEFFGFKPRSGAKLCKKWEALGFIKIANPSNKNRTYQLSPDYEELMAKKKSID